MSILLGVLPALPAWADSKKGGDWPMFGRDLQNSAAAANEAVPLKDIDKLKPRWVFTTGGDVSARPAISGGVAYVPDWGGNLWAIDTKKGVKIWGRQLSSYGVTGSANGVYNSRTTPAVADGVLYIGLQEGGWLLAIQAATGNLIWKTQLEPSDPLAIVTTSPAVHAGVVYTGVASLQEGAAANPNFPCCNARGSAVAVDARTGALKWKTYMVPPGYSGGGVWGSNFVIDASRRSVFVSTGNNYAPPTDPAYLACVGQPGATAAGCNSPHNHVDAVVALDMGTGAVKWSFRGLDWNQPFVANGTDNWNVACLVGFAPGTGNCPAGMGPDYDFASAPNLITYQAPGGPRTILGAGQKSGLYFALDPDSGALLWRTQVGPGSALGGMEWGSATDGKRIYVSIANLYGIPTGVGGAGSWAALNPADGRILWQVGDPNGAITLGPLTVAGDVVFVSSMAGDARAPTMLGLNAATGQTVWSFAAGSSVNAGPAVVDGLVVWGSGYAHLGIPGFTGNNRLYGFSKNGN